MRIYGLFIDGEKVDEGVVSDLARKYFIDRNAVYIAEMYKRKLLGKYEVKVIGLTEKRKPVHTKKEDRMECYIRHLKQYGNTVVNPIDTKNMKGLLRKLKENGLNCTYDVYTNRIDSHLGTFGNTKRKRKDHDYILRVI